MCSLLSLPLQPLRGWRGRLEHLPRVPGDGRHVLAALGSGRRAVPGRVAFCDEQGESPAQATAALFVLIARLDGRRGEPERTLCVTRCMGAPTDVCQCLLEPGRDNTPDWRPRPAL